MENLLLFTLSSGARNSNKGHIEIMVNTAAILTETEKTHFPMQQLLNNNGRTATKIAYLRTRLLISDFGFPLDPDYLQALFFI